MKTDPAHCPRLLARLIAAALALAVVLPFASWIIWSFGLPAGSLLSAEGLRWLALRAVPHSFSRHLAALVLALSAVGVWQLALAHPTVGPVRSRAFKLSLAASVLLVGGALVAALSPESPLLSINGTLRHSPFSVGIIAYAPFCATVLGLVYAAVVGVVRNASTLATALVHGPRLHAPWLLLAVALQYDWACICYVMGEN